MIKHTHDPLIFNAQVNKVKYSKTDENERQCPFCDKSQQNNILKTEGDKVWLMNKFQTIEQSFMTVLIESAKHDGDITTYDQRENRELFRFAMDCWKETMDSHKYKSVLMFKNFGPMSGGSLRHPHFQIIGLESVEGYDEILPDNFKGPEALSEPNLVVTLSTSPIMGTVEINVITYDLTDTDAFADAVQKSAQYLMNDFHDGRCHSYNLFFYQFDRGFICKLVPRFLTSPYFIGYKIPQVYTKPRLQEIVAELKGKLC